jgi:hypothetical protein
MNRKLMKMTNCKAFQCFVSVLTVSTFLLASEVSLCAQSGQSSSSQMSKTQTQSSNPQTGTTQTGAPQTTTGQALPDAPQPVQTQDQTQQEPAQAPSGAAGAKAANVKGTTAAQPVGAAVAPAKEHGHRSLLIKVGLIAGAAVAVGVVVALSEKSPTRPPGSTPAAK